MFHGWSTLRCWLYLRYLVATGRSSVAVPHHAAPQLRLIVQKMATTGKFAIEFEQKAYLGNASLTNFV
jgi:hypothetical protein